MVRHASERRPRHAAPRIESPAVHAAAAGNAVLRFVVEVAALAAQAEAAAT
jgi:hypothetical protein